MNFLPASAEHTLRQPERPQRRSLRPSAPHTQLVHDLRADPDRHHIIGDDVLIGPRSQLITGLHPLDPDARAAGLEYAAPIRIENKAWLASSVIVLPGVTIGEGAVIGAGSVVTKDVPPKVFAAGNPCRMIKDL